jgi:hypothetical protein
MFPVSPVRNPLNGTPACGINLSRHTDLWTVPAFANKLLWVGKPSCGRLRLAEHVSKIGGELDLKWRPRRVGEPQQHLRHDLRTLVGGTPPLH